MFKKIFILLIIFIPIKNCDAQKVIKKNIENKQHKNIKPNTTKRNDYKKTKYVIDSENLLTKNQIDTLNDLIKKFEIATTNEVVIVSINNEMCTAINFDSTVLAIHNKLGVGKYKINNGIVIGISSTLRKIRISNGDGVREKLTNEKTKFIIDEIMIPQFKDNKFYIGLLKGLQEIKNILM